MRSVQNVFVLFVMLAAVGSNTMVLGLFCHALSFSSTVRKGLHHTGLPTFIPRVSVNDFDPNQYYQSDERPVFVEGVLSSRECESLTDQVIENCGDIMIALQRQQQQEEEETMFYECTFHQALQLILNDQSKPGDALLAFCEGLLLENDRSLELQQLLDEKRESVFNIKKNKDDPCWFQEYFPSSIQPSDCVILAGEGATSTFHRDPFEWTGTSLCLDGTKLWRFVKPSNGNVKAIDQVMDSYRLDSVAWGNSDEDDLTISSGWQSDYSLFAKRSETVPRAQTLYDNCGGLDNLQERIQHMESTILTNLNDLQPSQEIFGNDGVEIWTGIQRPGDLLIIPAHWWHQTYAMETSLAVASQRCGIYDSERVLAHILETATRNLKLDLPKGLNGLIQSSAKKEQQLKATTASPQEIVDRLFEYIATIKP